MYGVVIYREDSTQLIKVSVYKDELKSREGETILETLPCESQMKAVGLMMKKRQEYKPYNDPLRI